MLHSRLRIKGVSPAVEVSALPSVPLAAKTKGCCCGGETAKVKEAIGSCCSRCDGMAESNCGSCCGPPSTSKGCIGIPVEKNSAVYVEQQRVLASAKRMTVRAAAKAAAAKARAMHN